MTSTTIAFIVISIIEDRRKKRLARERKESANRLERLKNMSNPLAGAKVYTRTK